MRRLMAVLCTLALAGGVVAAATLPTNAAPDDAKHTTTISGGDGNEANPRAATVAELAQEDAKGAVAEAAFAARHRDGSVEEYDKARQAYAKRFPDAPGFEPLNVTGPLAANTLTLHQIGQKTSWWCGPATASMMIKQMYLDGEISTTRSQYGNQPKRGQKALSKPAYLDAVDDGTYRTDLRRGLNRWIGNSYYSVLSNPTVAQFRTRLAQDIDTGWSLAVAALEPANSSYRYNGHPSGVKVDHWVPAFGYKNSFDTTKFADSATTLWAGVGPKFTHNTEKFVKRYVKPAKAIVW